MNKSSFIMKLMELFAVFSCDSALISELASIMKNSGSEKQLLAQLARGLKTILDKGVMAAGMDGFERLKGTGGLFSMHLESSRFNVRILYCFLSDGSPVLLLAFCEEAGKKKTDYTLHIAAAQDRLTQMKGEQNNE